MPMCLGPIGLMTIIVITQSCLSAGGPALLRGMDEMTSLQPVIVTGAAGFIGMHVCKRLLARGEQVVGIDSFTPYYDPALKRARLATLEQVGGFKFYEIDLADFAAVTRVFNEVSPDRAVHLAAQPGVRASIDDPITSIRANCDDFVTTTVKPESDCAISFAAA